MNWRNKARIQKVISSLPLSDTLYYLVQRTAGSLRPGHNKPLEWLQAAAQLADWVEGTGQKVAGARFLEVGTGRHISCPLGLWLFGADRTITVDLNRYLSEALVLESLDYLRSHELLILETLGSRATTELFRKRFALLTAFRGRLSDLLQLTNIEYRSPANAVRLQLPDNSVDVHFSYAVFEHIPADVILGILNEARRVLVPGGLLVHVIDPSDHFSHDDSSITAVNFLQYDDGEWTRMAGNKFMYHNRMRSCEYLDLFKQVGMRILRKTETVDEGSLRTLRNGFPLFSKFRHFEIEQLAIRSLNVMGTFD